MTQPIVPTDYLGIGRQLARLLGSSWKDLPERH